MSERLQLPEPAAEAFIMDAALFNPHDAAALLAIRALAAQRPMTPEDWLAAITAHGLLDEVDIELPLAA